jgi:hypothetical protein
MSLESYSPGAGASFAVLLLRIFVILAAPTLGFMYAESFEYCGPRLLSLAAGVALIAPAAGGAAVRIMKFDVFGAIVFTLLATAFVYFAGPMMDGCKPGLMQKPVPAALSHSAVTPNPAKMGRQP